MGYLLFFVQQWRLTMAPDNALYPPHSLTVPKNADVLEAFEHKKSHRRKQLLLPNNSAFSLP